MLLQLELTPYPDEIRAWAALEAVRVVCDAGRVAPIVAKRDHAMLDRSYTAGLLGHMVSPAEIDGAYTWEVALAAARHMLGLPADACLEIKVVAVKGVFEMVEQHGPGRHVWRRRVAVDLDQWAKAKLA